MRKHAWLPREDFGLLYGIARLTPGTNVLAFIAAMGARIKGWKGGIAAVIAASLPSAVFIWLMTVFFNTWKDNRWVGAALAGALAAVVALILHSAWQLLQPFRRSWLAWTLAILSFALGAPDLASPLVILMIGGIAGAIAADK
jgi:chromate transporter